MVVRTLVLLALALVIPAHARALPFAQDWSDTALIVSDDDWAGVPGIVGYRGDGLVADAGFDPQEVLADGSATPVDVLANRTSPAAVFTGGVAEFELSDPVVALQPSGTADAPHIVLSLAARGLRSIRVAYVLRDVDSGPDDAVQPVALQYRVGAAGDFVNVPAGFVADASGAGPGELETRVSATLPTEANGRALLQIRILTANAIGSDEWVGVDEIAVTGVDALPPALAAAAPVRLRLGRALRRGVPATVTVDEPASLRLELRISARLARRLRLPAVVGRGVARVEAGKSRALVRFSLRARRRLALLRGTRVSLRIAATDAAGNSAAVARRVLLAR